MIPKFRVWDKDSKVMREIQHLVWAEDNLIAHCPPRWHEFSEWFTVILNGWEYQLMQSTGLKDKVGVDIYEGDVVKMDRPPVNEKSLFLVKDYVLGKVIFAEVNEFGKDSWSFNGGYTGYSLEVIGNIYENPELLEEE